MSEKRGRGSQLGQEGAVDDDHRVNKKRHGVRVMRMANGQAYAQMIEELQQLKKRHA